MFGVNTINELSLGEKGDELWSSSDNKGHSSPRWGSGHKFITKHLSIWLILRNIRPWAYIAAKEDYKVLDKLVKELEDEATQVETGGIDVETASGNKYHIKVETLEMSMIGMIHI